MAKLSEIKQYSKSGKATVAGYRVTLSKTGVESTGLQGNEQLHIEYKKNEIIIRKEEK